MKWLQQIKIMKKYVLDYHKSEFEENRDYHRQRAKIKMQYNSLILKKREYKKRLGLLRRLSQEGTKDEQIELMKKLSELDSQIHEAHVKQHLNAFHNGSGDENFDHYYRHIRNTRPLVLIFNLVLWFLLFRFGGVANGLKIIILLFAFTTSFGSLFEMIFLIKIKERILKPIDNVIKGVNEIAQGNNEVTLRNEHTNEISSLIKAFNEMTSKLREGERLKNEYEGNRKALLANISHDLKTPITSIQGYVELITSNAQLEEDQLNRYLKIVYNNADYMNRLIDDLFLFSKLDMQKLDFHFEDILFRPFIKDMLEEFHLDLSEKKAAFEYIDTLKGDYIVTLDTKRFFQIVRNIIGNAVIHGPIDGLSLKVKLYEAKGVIRIDIADNGCGISEEHLEHIFERFYRVEVERTKSLSSTGLGLAISKELIQAHGGEISVVSEINKGSCFTITLPYLQNSSN